jgi:hypothetical protein
MGEGAEFARGLDDTERQCKSRMPYQNAAFRQLISVFLQYSAPLTTAPMPSGSGLRHLKSLDDLS